MPLAQEKATEIKQMLTPGMAQVFTRLHHPLDVMLLCARWYMACPLSLRHLEEMMLARGIKVDHSSVHR